MPEHTPQSQVGKLTFDPDKGAARSRWIAGLFALVLIGWMGSGYIIPTAEATQEEASAPQTRPISVAAVPSSAQDVQLLLQAEGQSEPDRAANVRSESGGQVVSVSATRGDLVTAGQELARIDDTTSLAQQTQAQRQLDQAARDLANAQSLQTRGLATEDRVTNARAAVAAAEAALANADEALENLIIRAPFDGRLNELTLDEGEFVSMGDVVAEVLDNDPLTVVIQVPQQSIGRLEVGQRAIVRFITGERRPANITFIGGNADAMTRTFRVELTVPNPDSELPAGLSARVNIPTGSARGHFVSPAILTLATDGTLGVKTIDAANTVGFSEVSIVRAQTNGIWVTGLAENANLITVGQGFVQVGDIVDPRFVDPLQPEGDIE